MNKNHLIMTPGPTEIEDKVLAAASTKGTNPDLDSSFYVYYETVVKKYNRLVGTEKGKSFFPAGEGILGLEMACLNLIEPEEKVLCISNGVFGAGFEEFVEFAGGKPVLLEADWKKGISLDVVKRAVAENPEISVATMAHCETPSGVTNDVHSICNWLCQKGIITIVDSVSAVGGEPMVFDEARIDCLLVGSQKCLSAPAGMSMVTLSSKAVEKIQNRAKPVKSYYLNFSGWLSWQENQNFPYTQPLQSVMGLEAAIDSVLETDYVKKHHQYGQAVRDAFRKSGFTLYSEENHSNTVTAVCLPDKIAFDDLFAIMRDAHGVLIGGGIGRLKGKVFRIGHMGANNKAKNMEKLFLALEKSFSKLGHNCDGLADAFRL